MAQIYYEDDAELAPIQDRSVAFLGYSPIAHAQALNLRDSGVDIRIGVPDDHPGITAALSAGLRVLSPLAAAAESDFFVCAAPEEELADYLSQIDSELVTGDAVLVPHAFAVQTGLVSFPSQVDLGLLAPIADGKKLRRAYAAGHGVAAVIAVAQDQSGEAWELFLSYAKALGALRAGAITTTFQEQYLSSVLAEQAVLGGVTALLKQTWQVLVANGVDPDLAYLTCLEQLPAVQAAWQSAQTVPQSARRTILTRQFGETAMQPVNSVIQNLFDQLTSEQLVTSFQSWGKAQMNLDPLAGTPEQAAAREQVAKLQEILTRVDNQLDEWEF